MKYKLAIKQGNHFKTVDFESEDSLEEVSRIGLSYFDEEKFESYALFQDGNLVLESSDPANQR